MRILDLQLLTPDLIRLKNFYAKVLRFHVVEISGTSFRVQIGYSNIEFSQSYSSPTPFYHFAINIPNNKFAEAKGWLSSRIEILSVEERDQIFFEDWNAHALYFYDPAGNIVEFIARHNLNTESREEFTPHAMLGVSEIGLPVSQIKPLYEQLHKELNLKMWRGNLEHFAALGDEQGLIILVTTKRGFLSLGKQDRAEIFPLQMAVEGESDALIQLTRTPYVITSVTRSKNHRRDP